MSIFKACDIRGEFGAELQIRHATQLGAALRALQGPITVLVAGDARVSTPALQSALIDSLLRSGCDVVDLGAVPTPLFYFARLRLGIQTGARYIQKNKGGGNNADSPDHRILLAWWSQFRCRISPGIDKTEGNVARIPRLINGWKDPGTGISCRRQTECSFEHAGSEIPGAIASLLRLSHFQRESAKMQGGLLGNALRLCLGQHAPSPGPAPSPLLSTTYLKKLYELSSFWAESTASVRRCRELGQPSRDMLKKSTPD